MLLEFRTRNYRSFRNEAAISLASSKDNSLSRSNTFETGSGNAIRLNRSAVIYGANASGKTNLLRALWFMSAVIQQSASLPPNQPFLIQPFRLDAKSSTEPTMFEVTVMLDGKRYQYGFEMTATRITGEWLLVYEKSKAQTWFERSAADDGDVYKFSTHLTGPKRVWQEATRPNALFLSTAVQLNSEVLAPLHRWFSKSLSVFLDGGGPAPFDISSSMIATPEGHRRITSMLAAADIAISSISTKATKAYAQQLSIDVATGRTSSQLEETELQVPTFQHRAGGITADFEFSDESQGTQKLFSLSGHLFDVLERGGLLAIDELDRSLHPLLVRRIIETFHDPVLNSKGAQLLFTTHDTSLLDHKLLRRDQIWFTEKQADQSSGLVPLSDFSPRKGEAFEHGYLTGRYGGVPILANHLVSESGRVGG